MLKTLKNLSDKVLYKKNFVSLCIFLFIHSLLYSKWQIAEIGFSKTHLNSKNFLFTENKGQLSDQHGTNLTNILYVGDQGRGVKIYFEKNRLYYVIIQSPDREELEEKEEHNGNAKHDKENDTDIQTLWNRIDMEFMNANPNAKIIAKYPTSDIVNYYLPHSNRIQSKRYAQLIYEDIYPGIDIVYKGVAESAIEYDIIIKPGADPTQIKIKYTGYERVFLDETKQKLSIQTSLAEINEHIPSVYQIINGQKIEIKGNYHLEKTSPLSGRDDNIKTCELAFHLTSYNANYPLIIDPWVTYYGGNGNDAGIAITTDKNGNVIITGSTASDNFPISNAYQGTLASSSLNDMFIAKFDTNGNRLWATYYGGNDNDQGNGITTDNNRNIILTGNTSSNNFPVFNAFQQTLATNGGLFAPDDAFVVKFDENGNRLWATYYGGDNYDNSSGIATDHLNNIIFTGYTASPNFPVINAFKGTLNGSEDAFVVKFDANGNRLWATYYGGSNGEGGTGIASDNLNNIVFTGYTSSLNFPVINAFQSTLAGGSLDVDAFVVKFDANGNRLWATYYGGNFNEDASGITCDNSNNIIFTGTTFSSDFPVANAFQSTLADSGDVYLVKFDANGNRLWATYFGGTHREEGYAVAVNTNNAICIGGDTYSPDFPTTSCALQTQYGGVEDNFIARFDPDGNLLCSRYIGGIGHDEATGSGMLALVAPFAYITGYSPGDYPVTSGAFQTLFGGGTGLQPSDAFVVQSLCGCFDTIPIPLVVVLLDSIAYPNVFSPNGDMVNDVFKPVVENGITNYSIKIYDRWGTLVYESAEINAGWDGRTTSGTNVSNGVYYWVAQYTIISNNETADNKGFITLAR